MTRTLAGVVCAVLLALAAAPQAQGAKAVRLKVGDPFPTLEGEYLTGRKATLPLDSKGKTALVLMGFTYQSRFMVEAWSDPVRQAFAKRPGSTWFEVPVLGGMARMGRWFIDRGMRNGTPKELHENVITVWGNVDEWKTRMGFIEAAEDDAYLALIGPDGRVRWLHHGPFAPGVLDEILAIQN